MYNQGVKKNQFFVLWMLVGITLPLILMLAWNQFNWLQELQNREAKRIEEHMLESAQRLTKRFSEEILFLPSMLRFRKEDRADLDTVFSGRYRYWQYYALYPSMVTGLYILDDERGTASEWTGSGFAETEARRPAQEPGFLPYEDTDREVRISLPFIDRGERGKRFLCVIDKEILFRDVIPAIAGESLGSTEDYAYRILDTRTGKQVYSSEDITRPDLFDSPDLTVPVLEALKAPEFLQPPVQARGPSDQAPPVLDFFGERPRNGEARPPENDRIPLFSYLVLQVANKDGSLENMARKATMQNEILSFGTVALLAFVMIILAEATRRARQLALSQQEFIATITHELKTPLAVISSAAQNLTDGLIKDQQKAEQYGLAIRKEAARLGISIEHFLLYSNTHSIDRSKPVLCPVSELVEVALRFTEEERSAGQFRTEVVLPEKPVFVRGDRIALESVFQNLAQNVMKHARDGRYLGITVSVETGKRKDREERVIIRFRDKGPGIPAREQKQIFEPFARGRRAIDNQIPGNGIGLNLVRRIITVHGGRISVESRPGCGSTFIVSLPAIKEEHVNAQQNPDD